MKKTIKTAGSIIVATVLLGCGESSTSSTSNTSSNADVTINAEVGTINSEKSLKEEATKQGFPASLNKIRYAIKNEVKQDIPVVEISFKKTTVYGVTVEKSKQTKEDAMYDAHESLLFINLQALKPSELQNSVLCNIPQNTIAKELNATLRSCVENAVVDNVTLGKTRQFKAEGNSTSYAIPYIGNLDNIKITLGDVNNSASVTFDVNASDIYLPSISLENPDNTRMELMINGLAVVKVADENKTLTQQREAQESTLVKLSENIDAKFNSLETNTEVINSGLALLQASIDEHNGYDATTMSTAKENLLRAIGISENTYSEIQVLYAKLQKGIDERFQKASVLENPNAYENEVRSKLTLASQKISEQKNRLNRMTLVLPTPTPSSTPTPTPSTGGGGGGEF